MTFICLQLFATDTKKRARFLYPEDDAAERPPVVSSDSSRPGARGDWPCKNSERISARKHLLLPFSLTCRRSSGTSIFYKSIYRRSGLAGRENKEEGGASYVRGGLPPTIHALTWTQKCTLETNLTYARQLCLTLRIH